MVLCDSLLAGELTANGPSDVISSRKTFRAVAGYEPARVIAAYAPAAPHASDDRLPPGRTKAEITSVNRFQAWYRAQPRALRALLTINVVLYVVWQLGLVYVGPARAFVLEHLTLHPGLPGILFEPWQLLTYNFLHLSPGLGGFLHILFNMLWLVWVGRDYEELYGPHRLLSAYVLGGLGGGLLTVLLNALLPGTDLFGAMVYGASASVLGVLTTVAVLDPEKSIGLLFIGTVRLIWVVIAFLVLDLLFLAGSNTSISAHLGGAFTGFLLARAEGGGANVSGWARVFFRDRSRARTSGGSRRPQPAPKGGGLLARLEAWLARRGGRKERPKPKPKPKPSGKARITRLRPSRTYDVPEDAEEDGIESEVDRILDKISEEGYDALTDEEKRVLYEASRR